MNIDSLACQILCQFPNIHRFIDAINPTGSLTQPEGAIEGAVQIVSSTLAAWSTGRDATGRHGQPGAFVATWPGTPTPGTLHPGPILSSTAPRELA
ncbi:MAG: hypothetical protein OXH79_18790 [Boseongicola sp.]|nr:hypothetical protein [Boseongicola sp.]